VRSKKRKYISIYFSDGNIRDRKKRDVTISFDDGDLLYEKCRKLGSSRIKRILRIDLYQELIQMANDEDRPIANFIKFRLRKYFEYKDG